MASCLPPPTHTHTITLQTRITSPGFLVFIPGSAARISFLKSWIWPYHSHAKILLHLPYVHRIHFKPHVPQALGTDPHLFTQASLHTTWHHHEVPGDPVPSLGQGAAYSPSVFSTPTLLFLGTLHSDTAPSFTSLCLTCHAKTRLVLEAGSHDPTGVSKLLCK